MLWVIGFGPKLTQTGPNSTQISVRYDEIPTKTFLASPLLAYLFPGEPDTILHFSMKKVKLGPQSFRIGYI